MRLSPRSVVGVGDAENDLAFLDLCGCAVAVANALPSVKAKAHVVVADHGAGIVEIADMLVRDDLASVGTQVRDPTVPAPEGPPWRGQHDRGGGIA
jgi:3-deoxy-D-manno-octulosonate 8-phosphate phosphatase KdsC-like HAD superfamily phosphatase